MDLAGYHNILLFGGTFDPPHIAHVRLPEIVRQALNADVIVYLPTPLSPFKLDEQPSSEEDRIEMLRLALEDQPRAIVSTLEIDIAGAGSPAYTVDTLRALRGQVGPGPCLYLLMGADQARSFHKWREHEAIMQLCEPVVMVRPPHDEQSLLDELAPHFDTQDWAARIIRVPAMEVSSTGIRRRVREGEPIAGLVPPPVERYIHERSLYR